MKFPCPTCGQATRAIKPITLRSLLTESARSQVVSFEGFRFCPSTSCELLYVQPETNLVFGADAVTVSVFQKSTEATRPVCYCFEHSVSEVRQEATQPGDSQIVESITDKCRKGEDLCEETNPQGSCCLGNVRAVIRQTRADQGLGPATGELAPEPSCCSAPCEAKPKAEEN
jgi:hypothetical protein